MAYKVEAYKAGTSGKIFETMKEAEQEDIYNELCEFISKNTAYNDSEAVLSLIEQHGDELLQRLTAYMESKQ